MRKHTDEKHDWFVRIIAGACVGSVATFFTHKGLLVRVYKTHVFCKIASLVKHAITLNGEVEVI